MSAAPRGPVSGAAFGLQASAVSLRTAARPPPRWLHRLPERPGSNPALAASCVLSTDSEGRSGVCWAPHGRPRLLQPGPASVPWLPPPVLLQFRPSACSRTPSRHPSRCTFGPLRGAGPPVSVTAAARSHVRGPRAHPAHIRRRPKAHRLCTDSRWDACPGRWASPVHGSGGPQRSRQSEGWLQTLSPHNSKHEAHSLVDLA